MRFHDTNLDIYNHRAKKVLDRYSPFNGDNIDKYSKLIKQYIGLIAIDECHCVIIINTRYNIYFFIICTYTHNSLSVHIHQESRT